MSEPRSAVTFDAQLAVLARGVLAYPEDARLVVDGVPDVLGAEPLGLEDVSGEPTFACPPGSPLADAAAARRSALLTLASGLGEPGSVERRTSITLSGRLESRGRQDCPCCTEVREVVVLDLNFVLLAQPAPETAAGSRPDEQFRVPLAEFRSSAHLLNPGYLRRTLEHANHCHQPELRRAVSRRTGTRYDDIAAVALADLHRDRVEVRWVDPTGARAAVHAFPFPARTPEELGRRLRRELDTRLC